MQKMSYKLLKTHHEKWSFILYLKFRWYDVDLLKKRILECIFLNFCKQNNAEFK